MSDTPTITPEVLNPDLAEIVKPLDESSALVLTSTYTPFLQQVETWSKQIANITDPKLARASRLTLKGIRVDAEKKKDALKSDLLTRTRAIDAGWNLIKGKIQALEDNMEQIEKAAEIKANAERDARIKERSEKLTAIGTNPAFFNLGDMPEDQFAELLNREAEAAQKKIEAAKKAEEERIAKEKADAEERERIKAENERLKQEAFEAAKREEEERNKRAQAEARMKAEVEAKAEADRKARADLEAKLKAQKEAAEAEARKEREAVEAKAKAEKEAAEKVLAAERAKAAEAARIAREAQEKAEAEAKRLREEAAAKAKAEAEEKARAAAAPDREKLLAVANAVRAIAVPLVSSPGLDLIAKDIAKKRDAFAVWIETQVGGVK